MTVWIKGYFELLYIVIITGSLMFLMMLILAVILIGIIVFVSQLYKIIRGKT